MDRIHKPKSITVLSVISDSRYLALAVINGGTLIYYAVRSLTARGRSRQETAKDHVAEAIAIYHPNFAVTATLQQVDARRSTVGNFVFGAINRVLERGGIPVKRISLADARSHICSGNGTRRRTTSRLIMLFPELRRYLRQRSRYYQSLFNSVALSVYAVWLNRKEAE